MRYLGILCIQDKNVHYKYIAQLEGTLKNACAKVIRVVCESNGSSETAQVIRNARQEAYEGIVLLKDEMFGAFYDLNEMLERMEGKFDVWGLDYDRERSCREKKPVLYDCFLVIGKRLLESSDFWDHLTDADWPAYILSDGEMARGSVISDEPDIKPGIQKEHQISLWRHMPYETVVRKKIPFLMIRSFCIDKMLEYSLQHELRRTLDHLEREGFDTDGIWEYAIAELDIGDLKRVLHLEYPIWGNCPAKTEPEGKKAAVFAHIYYEDLYDRCIAYLKNIPREMDIYVSTKESGRALLEEKLWAAGVTVKKVAAAGKRGRDAGALLLAFAPFLGSYDYICFVHDKKSSGGLAPLSEGMAFMDLVWDNLVPDSGGIYEILELFKRNPFLGLIAPPIPFMGSYFASLVGDEWTVCFEETKKLAEKLGVGIKISEEKLPFVLSTCFWCRREALEDLFRYGWREEDFPQEPLKLDGTVNHAIERILPYLAQRRGFYSAVAYQAEYASIYLNNLSYVVDEVFLELKKSELTAVKFPLELYSNVEFIRRLIDFTRKHREIYVYGAGAQGKILKKKLDMIGVSPAAFLVSRREGNKAVFEGCKVELFTDMKNDMKEGDGIILAMSNKFADEVIPLLGDIDYFRIGVD